MLNHYNQPVGRPVDVRCDLFSLGCVLYQISTGRMAFQKGDRAATLTAVASEQPRTPLQVNPQVPPALSRLILRLLAKKP